MREHNTVEMIRKLIGPTIPIGDSRVDADRYENLKELLDVIENLLDEVSYIEEFRGRQESSLHQAGKKAQEFLNSLDEYRR